MTRLKLWAAAALAFLAGLAAIWGHGRASARRDDAAQRAEV